MRFFSSMLPSLGDTRQLITFGPALFARLEKVRALLQELQGAEDRSGLAKCVAEEQMLVQVLAWINNSDLESNP